MEGFGELEVESIVRIAVLMACHNRQAQTLACLRSLACAAQEFKKNLPLSTSTFSLHLFLNDDGSTDGTGEAVQEWSASATHHSSFITLHLIRSNGADYWARGMSRAWQAALDYEKEAVHCPPPPSTSTFSHFLWLNDDVVLRPDSLSSLLRLSAANPDSVVIGECCDPDDAAKKTYGLEGRWLNGNVVLVPRTVYDKVGMIDGTYAHSKADYDYAERVRRAGFGVVATDGFVGTCRADWQVRFRGLGLRRRLHMLFEPCYWNLRDLWHFRCKYYGMARAVVSSVHLVWMALRGVR